MNDGEIKKQSVAGSGSSGTFSGEKNSISILGSFKRALCYTKETEAFSADHLNWIAARKSDWDNDKIRVGVIGVTSCGKSTVINSILGIDILSSAVTPSTGQLVSCEYGPSLQVTVYLQNGKQKCFSGRDFRTENLKKYTDENFNSKNKEKVERIELTSPYFALAKDVMLVDSPGLDAFGLDQHEKITLESLVPTIDACIYVVTMKGGSDRKTKEVLDVINRYSCPIIIVQNKLDSVRPSVDGRKSKAQIAEEHRTRVRRIVECTEIKDKNSVSIIQMSAKDAKDGIIKQIKGQEVPASFKYSNYDIFIETVNGILKSKRPSIENVRIKTILNRMNEVVKQIDEKAGSTETVSEAFPLKEMEKKVNNYGSAVGERYNEALEAFSRAALEVFDLIGIGEANEVRTQLRVIVNDNRVHAPKNDLESNFDKATLNINNAVDGFVDELKNIVADYNEFVKPIAQGLSIPLRDLRKSITLRNHSEKIFVSKKTKTVSEKQKGFLGSIKRGLGWLFGCSDWGYEEPTDKIVPDYEKTQNDIVERVMVVIGKDTKSFESWYDNQFKPGIQKITDAIEQEKIAYNVRRQMQIQVQDLLKVREKLGVFLAQKNALLNEVPEAFDTISPKTEIDQKTITVTPVVEKAVNLAQHTLQLQHRSFAKSLLKNIGVQNYEAVLISWDEGSVDTFLWQTGIKPLRTFRSHNSEIVNVSSKPICYFVFVDAPQIGSARKQIYNTRLDKIIKRNDCLIWVVQDFNELQQGQGETGSAAVEGLRCVQDLPALLGFDKHRNLVWLLHSNPIINFAFVVSQLEKITGIGPEQKLLKELHAKYPYNLNDKTVKLIGEIIRLKTLN